MNEFPTELGELQIDTEIASTEVYDEENRAVATFYHFDIGPEMADRYAKMLVSTVKRNRKRSKPKGVETLADDRKEGS